MSPETPTLHDLLRKVPEDHPLQLTHLALNKTGICIDSFTLPHLRSLISLDLRNLPAPSYRIDDASFTSERQARASSTADICAILRQEGIYLKNVIVSDVGAFDYLCSYSGLETLDLCFMAFNTVEESNASALTFYKSVLPQLVHSLQVLKIRPKHEGRWCFNPEDVFQSVVFSQCNKLRSLSVALNSIPNTNSLFQYKYNVDDSVCPNVLVISLIYRPWRKRYCRSHHSSTYPSAYPPSVKFIFLYLGWHSRVMSFSCITRIQYMRKVSWNWLHAASPSFRFMMDITHRISGNFCLTSGFIGKSYTNIRNWKVRKGRGMCELIRRRWIRICI